MQYDLVKQFTFVKLTEENIWDFKFDKDSITFNDIMNFEHTGSTFSDVFKRWTDGVSDISTNQ